MRQRGPYPGGGGSTDLSNYYTKPQTDALVSTGGKSPTDAMQTQVTLSISGSNVIVTANAGSTIQWIVGGVTKSVSSPYTITGGFTSAHATLDRIDLVIAKSDGTLAVTTGTAADPPTEPTTGTGEVRVGLIYVPSVASGNSPSTGTGGAASGIVRVKALVGSAWIPVNADDGLSFERSSPIYQSVTRAPDENNAGKTKIRVFTRIDVGSGKLLGDSGSGAGDVTVGSGLALTAGVLTSSGGVKSSWTAPWVAATVITGSAMTSDLTASYLSYQNPPALNDEVELKFDLDSGTYQLVICGHKNTNYGTNQIKIDGTTAATIDWYYASAQTTVFRQNVTISTSGEHTLRSKVTGKNGSSSDYYIPICFITFIK